jgi:hypothetical protein
MNDQTAFPRSQFLPAIQAGWRDPASHNVWINLGTRRCEMPAKASRRRAVWSFSRTHDAVGVRHGVPVPGAIEPRRMPERCARPSDFQSCRRDGARDRRFQTPFLCVAAWDELRLAYLKKPVVRVTRHVGLAPIAKREALPFAEYVEGSPADRQRHCRSSSTQPPRRLAYGLHGWIRTIRRAADRRAPIQDPHGRRCHDRHRVSGYPDVPTGVPYRGRLVARISTPPRGRSPTAPTSARTGAAFISVTKPCTALALADELPNRSPMAANRPFCSG